MGLGPVYATRKIARNVGEFDMIEMNEVYE